MDIVADTNVIEQWTHQARTALQHSTVISLREVTVQSMDNGLRLTGQVASFYHKQRAQELVRAAAPGVHVVNAITVAPWTVRARGLDHDLDA